MLFHIFIYELQKNMNSVTRNSSKRHSLRKYYEDVYIVFNKERRGYMWWEIGKSSNQQKKKEKSLRNF